MNFNKTDDTDDTDEEVFRKYYEPPYLDDFKDMRSCSPFLLFRGEVSKALKKGGRVKRPVEISTIASKLWATMHNDEKDQYHQLSAALSRQSANWSNSSSTQYLQTTTSNANLPGSELSRQLVGVSNISSMEYTISNINLPGSELSSQLVDVSNISSEEHHIPNANSPESEYFIYSKER
ncbi:6050_t:CDS:1 [Ambispora leptoticha]|uniref:6050_t:CDS:1 n=1 Tax=Ambispora leptoticha TaxID=144679 RepID=A0A9N8WMX0_9GLOM|nr:6050_t:CDS:1 [Ambispora leptoticha]